MVFLEGKRIGKEFGILCRIVCNTESEKEQCPSCSSVCNPDKVAVLQDLFWPVGFSSLQVHSFDSTYYILCLCLSDLILLHTAYYFLDATHGCLTGHDACAILLRAILLVPKYFLIFCPTPTLLKYQPSMARSYIVRHPKSALPRFICGNCLLCSEWFNPA
jgi:hypothetical protein